jgi:hypothetical protein
MLALRSTLLLQFSVVLPRQNHFIVLQLIHRAGAAALVGLSSSLLGQ